VTEAPLVVPQQASDRNRNRIILTLGQRGPLSRAELARLSGVSRTTIGTYVERLLDDGLIEELEAVAATGVRGRPSTPVWFRRDAARCGAVVFDRDRIDVGIVNARGEILARAHAPAPRAASTDAYADAVEDLLDRVVAPQAGLLGVGIGVGGVVSSDRGTVARLARFPAIDGDRLVQRITAAAGAGVVIENDAHCGALAELWWGHGRLHRSFWTVQIGEGIGGCGVFDGELTRGTRGHAGEIGHTTVDRGGRRCACGVDGCWETVAALPWLRREARDRRLRGWRSFTVERLARLAADGDDDARALAAAYAQNLAIGLTNLVHLVAPELIVLQGSVTAGGPHLLDLVRAGIGRRSLTGDDHGVELMLSELGSDARLLGAGALVMSSTWSLDA